jgi:hypothetical protein
MNIIIVLILVVLAYIAFQLRKLNIGKSIEEKERSAEKEDQRFREMFPHIYIDTNEEDKEQIREFVKKNEDDDELAGYIYNERYKVINLKIENETDEKRKEKMKAAKEVIVNELRQWQKIFDDAKDKKEISSWEVSYLLWGYLKAVNESFLDRHTDLESYLRHSGFLNLVSLDA